MEQPNSTPVIDFSSYISDRTRGFTERAWVFEELNAWLAKVDGTRFFLLTGEPGCGKTAISTRLIQLSTPGVISPTANFTNLKPSFLGAYHFCSVHDRRWINPHVFAESLALQLSARYPAFAQALVEKSSDQRIRIEVEQTVQNMTGGQIAGVLIKNLNVGGILPEDAFNRAVREPLRALFTSDPNQQVIILVDALDEALLYSGKVGIVALLAQADALPVGVRFILTSRNDPRVIDRFKQRHHLDLSSPEHNQDADTDIRRYVQQRMAEESMKQHIAAVGSAAEVEDHLVKHAAGNFLYAAFFLDEVIAGKRSLANMTGLPVGLYGLYRHYLDSILPEVVQANTSPKWVRQLQPLLGSLSVAIPAAPRDVLPEWLRLPKGKVWPLLNDVIQVTEYDPSDGGGYRLYHRSVAEFLGAEDYLEDNVPRLNRYFTPPDEQHERIVRYYLTNFLGYWQHCDLYGLRQLIGHMQARLRGEQNPKRQRKQVEELYAVILDPVFQRAQREKLRDIHATLTDLRTTLEIALARNDLVKVLASVGVYRDTTYSQSISRAIFDAAQQGNYERALQRVAHYDATPKALGGCEVILRLYLAWEAAEQGNTEVVQKVIAETGRITYLQGKERIDAFWGNKLSDALLVRTAYTLARITEGMRDARSWLTQWGLGQRADGLLTFHGLAKPLDPTALQARITELQQRLAEFEQLVDEGAAEAVSMVPLLDVELVGQSTANLQDLLMEVAADPSGQEAIDRALQLVLPNPYPRYRDIALVALGVACLAVPETSWVRTRLQSILSTALDHEGVTFTFDLPAMLACEAQKRNLPTLELAGYLDQALTSNDRWGTTMRARSAHAAALYRQGLTADAIQELEEAATQPRGFAGYATVTLLSLANRWWEFGLSGSPSVENLINDSAWQAEQVRDLEFREERMELVKMYCNWSKEYVPNIEAVLATLSATPDPDTRRVYKDFISARWAGPIYGPLNLEGLKALVPTALADGTTLDALLGRLFGIGISQLSNTDLIESIRLCTIHFTSNRPWELGQWR